MSPQTLKKLLIIVSIIVIALIGFCFYNQLQENANKERVRNNITSYVIAESSDYQNIPFGGIYNLNISVTNNSDYLLDNVKVKVTYIKLDGGIWQDKYFDFNFVDPHSKTTLKIPDTNRGVRVEYEIASIRSTVLNFN